jgi:short-chain Z-isoprenyl diphosphate synthase
LSAPPPELDPAGPGQQPAAAALPARVRVRPAGKGVPVPGGLGKLALAPLYRLYTHRLRERVRRALLPQHVAVILDGSRRWATELGLTEPGAGHRHGAAKIDELLGWCSALGIGEVTVWALSGENVSSRPSPQLESLYEIVAAKLDSLADVAQDPRLPLRIRVLGRREPLPPSLREAVERVESESADEGLRLNIALGYSGRDELVDACRRLVRDLAEEGVDSRVMAERVTQEALADRLYTAGGPDPDLIIRTSGELRMSGFLPWQSAHSEFYFTDVYWPALRELDFLRALRTFQQRERRFGA